MTAGGNSDISRVRAHIDIRALKNNVATIRRIVGKSKISAVVKADAYGHGLENICHAIDDVVDGFSVARVCEGVALRRLGTTLPIWVLSGCMSVDELGEIERYELSPVACDLHQIDLLRNSSVSEKVIIKVDTGLGRFGISTTEATELLRHPRWLKKATVILSHLSDADNLASEKTKAQIAEFNSITNKSPIQKSLAASAGLLAWPNSHFDWVRPGIALYGVSPFLEKTGADFGLDPVMTLKSVVVSIRTLAKGRSIGYGGEWICPERMPVGLVGCGYGDGYPRGVRKGASVLIEGQVAPIIGRISMDSFAVDLRSVHSPTVGQEVTLWGQGLPIEMVAIQARTITNELLTRLSKRVPRVT